jgi:hypothetical protein
MGIPPVTESVLTYEFRTQRPIDLIDLTTSLMAVGEQFRRFVHRHDAALTEDGYRLFIKEVRAGSIIAELVSYAVQSSMIMPAAPLVAQFGQEISDLFDFFKGLREARDIAKEIGLGKKDLQQIYDVIDPVAKDGGSQLNLIATHGGAITVNVSMNSMEANAVQNNLRRRIEAARESVTGLHEDQVLYWYQMRADTAEKPGDKAVIERFSRNPVKVRIASDEVKREMIDNQHNPFKRLFLVDVDVTEIDDKPVLYKILAVKDSWDRE